MKEKQIIITHMDCDFSNDKCEGYSATLCKDIEGQPVILTKENVNNYIILSEDDIARISRYIAKNPK